MITARYRARATPSILAALLPFVSVGCAAPTPEPPGVVPIPRVVASVSPALPPVAPSPWDLARAAQREMARGVLDASGTWTASGIAALEALETNLATGILSAWKGDLANDDTTDAARNAWLRATLASQNVTCVDERSAAGIGQLVAPSLKRITTGGHDHRWLLTLPIAGPDFSTGTSSSILTLDRGELRTLVSLPSSKGGALLLRNLVELDVSPVAENGEWYVAEAFSKSHITSRWTAGTFRIWKVSASARATMVHEESLSVVEGSLGVRAEEGVVALSFTSWPALGTWPRVFSRRYAVSGDGFEQLPTSYVVSPRDLMEELWRGDERAMKALALSSVRAGLTKMRAKIHGKEPDAEATILANGLEALDPSDLPDVVRVELACPKCRNFPTRLAFRARRAKAAGWGIVGLE